MIYLGVDIGVTGCIHVFDDKTGQRSFIDLSSATIQIVNKKKSKSGKPTHSTKWDVKKLVQLFAPYKNQRAAIELLSAVGSNFASQKFSATPQINFGLGFSSGAVMTALAANDISFQSVYSQTWKSKMLKGVAVKSDKEAIRLKAIQEYPECAQFLTRKSDHNRAESLFICEYGRAHWTELSYLEGVDDDGFNDEEFD